MAASFCRPFVSLADFKYLLYRIIRIRPKGLRVSGFSCVFMSFAILAYFLKLIDHIHDMSAKQYLWLSTSFFKQLFTILISFWLSLSRRLRRLLSVWFPASREEIKAQTGHLDASNFILLSASEENREALCWSTRLWRTSTDCKGVFYLFDHVAYGAGTWLWIHCL